MLELSSKVEKHGFIIELKEPYGFIFLHGKDVIGKHSLIALEGENDLDDLMNLCQLAKQKRKSLKEKYDLAIKAIQ